ncbi:hypothetical protein, partial [Vibrio cholerae]|uniref:hypothetical protein n=1 Tax=Vibrio cholerae TaxID=666 RepID=UPI0034A10C2C
KVLKFKLTSCLSGIRNALPLNLNTATATAAAQWDWKRHALTVPLEAFVSPHFTTDTKTICL